MSGTTTMNGNRPLMADPLRPVELRHKPTPEMIEQAEALRIKGETLTEAGLMRSVDEAPSSPASLHETTAAPGLFRLTLASEVLILTAAAPFVLAYVAWAWSVVRWAWRVIGGAPLW